MPSDGGATALRDALESLATAVEGMTFPTASPHQPSRVMVRDRVAWIIREYLLRRLQDLDAALRVVIVGPTGSGASTILNSLAGAVISDAGPLRPTTTVPVVWCDPDLEPDFAFDFLSGFGTTSDATRPLRVVAHRHPLVAELAIVDAPDFDSMRVEHREIARRLVDAADICLLVVSRHRYADDAVWRFVEHVKSRPTRLVTAMNRMDQGDDPAVTDFRQRLRHAGFNEDPIATVAEQPVSDQRLAPDAVEPIRQWLGGLDDPMHRHKTIVDSISSTLGGLFVHLDQLDTARHADVAEAQQLRSAATRIHRELAATLREDLTQASPEDLEALVARDIERAAHLTRLAWRNTVGGQALAADSGDGFSYDIGQLRRVSSSGVVAGEALDGVDVLMEEAGQHLAARVPMAASIGDVERAAAMVMEAGRRFLDA